RRKGHAEHDNQSYVPAGEIDRWATENDPIDRYALRLRKEFGVADEELRGIDDRVRREIDEATDIAERSATPEPLDALIGVYASPPAVQPLWFRREKRAAVEASERAEGWGTFSTSNGAPAESRIAREND